MDIWFTWYFYISSCSWWRGISLYVYSIKFIWLIGLLFTNCWHYWLFTSSFTFGCFVKSHYKESSFSVTFYQSKYILSRIISIIFLFLVIGCYLVNIFSSNIIMCWRTSTEKNSSSLSNFFALYLLSLTLYRRLILFHQ